MKQGAPLRVSADARAAAELLVAELLKAARPGLACAACSKQLRRNTLRVHPKIVALGGSCVAADIWLVCSPACGETLEHGVCATGYLTEEDEP